MKRPDEKDQREYKPKEHVVQTQEQADANVAALFAGVRKTKDEQQNEQGRKPEDDPAEEVEPEAPATDGQDASGSDAKFLPPQNGDVLTVLPIELLLDFAPEKHPFKPYPPERMEALKEDVRLHGILQPLLVRPHPTLAHRYEVIAGRNRRKAAKDVGYYEVPCIVREMSDDEALLQMISTNLQQREKLLPSEKAWAYRYELEVLNRQGIRSDLTCAQGGHKSDNLTSCHSGTKFRTDEEMAQSVDDSVRQIHRYIRLTYLTPTLLERVDNRTLPLTVGEVLSHISPSGQQIVENFCFEQRALTLTQQMAERCRKLDEDGELSEQALEQAFLAPVIVTARRALRITGKRWKRLRTYFDESATENEVCDVIETAVKEYFERQRR